MLVRLAFVAPVYPVFDPTHRDISMSTVMDSERWLIEAQHDGMTLGEITIWRNESVDAMERALVDANGEKRPPSWKWWNAIPGSLVKFYRLLDTATLQPGTTADVMPFELSDGKPKEESGKAKTSGGKAA